MVQGLGVGLGLLFTCRKTMGFKKTLSPAKMDVFVGMLMPMDKDSVAITTERRFIRKSRSTALRYCFGRPITFHYHFYSLFLLFQLNKYLIASADLAIFNFFGRPITLYFNFLQVIFL